MRLRKKKQSNAIQMDLTPMIDIVFLLIIFFITVTQITKANQEILPLPQVVQNDDQTPTRVVVNVRENSQIIVNGEGKSLDQTVYYLGQEIEAKGNDPSQVRVTLRVDFRSKARAVKTLVREMNSLGIVAIQIGVEGK
ncbi:MAG: biopolymer transporter ExbD [Pirellulaceae bacterium]|nr:biopolymer transporter ExbD [bacterium]MDG2470377.1 biopolymer transporter ExbD [Pirellulaceae bacterium]